MPRSINWFPWCDDTFTKALAENKPILMYLTARWCGWGSVMEDTTYRDPQVIHMVEENFIPMRVNVDQYPHVADRYHFGGYPSVVFLSGDGHILKGENYLPGDEMKNVLEEVLLKLHSPKSQISRKTTSGPSKIKTKTKRLQQKNNPRMSILEINKIVANSYDREFGGFVITPQEMKFPFPEIDDYLLTFSGSNPDSPEELMLKKTLDNMLAGEIYDHCQGGFFRFCEGQDWTLPHAEKLLDHNAALVRIYLLAFQRFGLEQYGIAARDTIHFLTTQLFDEVAQVFGGSRIGKEIDATTYTNWNSSMVSSLLLAYGIFGDPTLMERAQRILETLWSRCYRLGRGMSHFYLSGPSDVELLSDQIKYIIALQDAYLYTQEKVYLQRIRLLISYLEKNYQLPEGSFSDIPLSEKKPGYLSIPLVPFVENADVALAYIKASRLFASRVYMRKAEEIVKSLSVMVQQNPVFAAKYGQVLLEMENYRMKNQTFN